MAGFFGQMMDPETMGLLGMSAGLLQAGGPSRMPVSTGQALSQGLMGGMAGYGQGTQLQQQALQHKAAMAKLARDLQIQEASAALHGGAGAQQAAPQAPPPPAAPPALPIQLAGLSTRSAGAVGAPWAEAQQPPQLPPQLPQQAPAAKREFQPPYSQTALSRAAGQGVNVEQAIKQNAEARAQWELQNPQMQVSGGYVYSPRDVQQGQFLPTLGTEDTGGALRPYRTGPQGERTYLGNVPKTGAPGSIPFEMSDQTPAQARDFDLARRAAGATNVKQTVNPALDPFKNEKALRDEYRGSPVVKNADEMAAAFRTIETASKRPSPANDLAMATKYMKILDPTSVVRESELALAMNATGLVDRVRNYAEQVATGKKLNPAQRKDFYDSAKAINDAFQQSKAKLTGEYHGLAKQYGLRPENVTFGEARLKFNPDTGEIE